MQKILAILSAFVASVMALAGYSCRGTVVDVDTNEPLAGVRVTDGIHVTTSDENGEFSLKGWFNCHFVTVTTPAGYSATEFYIPFERNKDSYDFRLKKDSRTAEADHSFVQISDSEVGESGPGAWLDHVKQVAEEEDAAFVVHTGDICYTDGLKSHIKSMNSETMGRPVHYNIGNHDYVAGDYGEQLFESLYGPTWYSFDVGNTHYVMLPFLGGADYGSKYLPTDRWRWLKNDLDNTDPDKKVVIFNHNKPPKGHTAWTGTEFLKLAERNVIAWVYGHYHYNDVQINDGIFDISTARPDCGGIDQSAAGTRVIHIDKDGKLTTEFKYYNFSEDKATAPENAMWSSKLDGNALFGDTAVYNDKVYIGTVDEDYPRDCGVYCLNADDGSVIWKYATDNSIKNDVLIVNNTVIAQDAEGNVYCLNAETGKKIWKKKVNLNKNINTSNGICTDGKTIFAGSPTSITALDAKTGIVKWNKRRPSGECSGAEFVVKDDALLVSANWNSLTALNKNNGKELWSCTDGDIRYRSSTPYVTDDEKVIVADSDAIVVLDLKTGEILSKTDDTGLNFGISAAPVVYGDIVCFATAENGVVAFNLEEQKKVWQINTGAAMISTPQYIAHSQTVENIILHDGKVIFAGSDGFLYTADAESGKVLSKQNIGAPVLGNAAVYNDSIIVSDFAGRVSRVK